MESLFGVPNDWDCCDQVRLQIADEGHGMIVRSFASFLAALAFMSASNVMAESGPCSSDVYSHFDFWLGDWQVFRADNGSLAGVDSVQKTLSGCAISQRWTQLDDSFRPEGGIGRLQGRALAGVLPDGRWRFFWVDNSGFLNSLTGGVNEKGMMALESDAIHYPGPSDRQIEVYFRWYWQLQEDGTIRNWGETKIGIDGEWRESFNNIYVSNR